jgi:hypothetical protein
MVDFADDELQELTALFPGVQRAEEAGTTFFLIPRLVVPTGAGPSMTADALLCPTDRDGYPSRLYLSKAIVGGRGSNLNANNVRILERNWFALSWRVRTGLRLAQMIAAHLDAFRATK